MRRRVVNALRSKFSVVVILTLLSAILLVELPDALKHGPTFTLPRAYAASQNPIQVENSKPGTPGWDDSSTTVQDDALSGFGSKISVNHGDSIDFYVTTTAASFTIDIYRTGYYGGAGARLITSLGSFPGLHQAIPNPDPVTGLISCLSWTKTTTLAIPSDWVTGVYLAKLTAPAGNSSFIFFVVRDDGGNEDIVFQTSVTTYQAYNTWGGLSLYSNLLTNKSLYSYPHATKVSFDRPFNPGDSNGAGHYFFFEYQMVYWLESQGYNVVYSTDVDTDTNASSLTSHKAFLSVGHDEYWSAGMRNTVQNAINAGVNVAFFSANTSYWQIRFEPNSARVSDRVEVGYKDFAAANVAPGPDPEWNVNNAILTTNWRDPLVNQPENGLLGVMYEQQEDKDYAYVVQNASNWIYQGTGFVDGTSIPGIVGYEYDKVWNNGFTPSGVTVLSNSPVHGCCGGFSSFSNSTLYTAPSGARVFAAGTMQWSLGLSNVLGTTYENAGIQKTTSNILNNFIGVSSAPSSAVSLSPDSLSFGNVGVGVTSSAQTVTLKNTGTSALSISSIAVGGTNAGDFAQTNNCPGSLAANATCTINVTFKPTTGGSRSGYVSLTDSSVDSPQDIVLSGTGITSGPAVSLSPTSLNFGNQKVGTTSAAKTITVTNSGTSALTISSVSVSGTNSSDFAQTNTCSSSIASGASCTINVTFTPGAIGTRAGAITLTDNASDSPQTVSLSGTGASANSGVVLSPSNINFGNQKVGTTSAATAVALTNATTATLTISSIAVTGTNASDFAQTNNCPGSLAVNASCTINVTYSPGTIGTSSASISVTDDATGSPHTASLSGTGVSGSSSVYFNDGFESGDFSVWTNGASGTGSATVENSVVNTGTHAAQLTNASGQTVQISTTFSSGTLSYTRFYFRLSSLSTTTLVALGQDTTGHNQWIIYYDAGRTGLDIYFWNGAGTRYDVYSTINLLSANTWYSLEVEMNQITSGHGEVWLNGNSIGSFNGDLTESQPYGKLTLTNQATGSIYFDDAKITNTYNGPIAPTSASVSPSGFSFGNQNVGTTSATQAITVTNTGTNALTISNIALTGTNASDFAQTNNCPASLASNATCTINVTFSPSASGSRTASISVTDNAGDSPQVVALSGNGVITSPAVSLSPTSLSFGNQNVGTTSAAQAITLTNSGTAALTINRIAVTGTNASDFAQTNNCPGSLAVNATCTINVTYSPGAAGTSSASISVTDNAAGSPHTASLSGTGVSVSSTVYFSDGFESGNLSQWTNGASGTGSAAVENSVVHTGTYAAQLTNTPGQTVQISTTFSSGTLSYTRFYFQLASLSATTLIALGQDATGHNQWIIYYDAGRAGLDIYFWNASGTRYDVYSNMNVLSANTWYSLEVETNETTSGHGEVWLNGNSIGSFNGDLTEAQPYGELILTNQATGSIYFDDVKIANTY